MIKNKKADLSLSINAIVILILAITMLGLGLTFMRGLFKQATGKVESAVSSQELANPPTIDNPVTLYPSTLELRKTEQGKTLLAFMHAEGANRACTLTLLDKGGYVVRPDQDTRTVNLGTNPTIYDPGDYGAYDFFMTYNYNEVTGIPPDKIYTWTISIDPDELPAAADCGELEADLCVTGCTFGASPCPSTCDLVGSHIYTAKITCASGGTYKKDLLIKI